MAARLGNITVDCRDALVLGRFWAAVLGRALDPGADAGFASIGTADADRTEPAWLFEIVAEGKVAKNRMHVDLVDPDEHAVERIVALGATRVATHGIDGHTWTVLQDPEGNEFCVSGATYTG